MNITYEEIFSFSMILLVIVAVFLLIREIVCWYWKLNKIVDLLESIDKSLKGASIESSSDDDQKAMR
jgi:hypothetical protein